MRDIAITLIVAYGCMYTLKRPYIGILLWSWLSYMNPHRLAYGFAYSMPFAQVTAIVLLVSMFFSKDTKMFPINKVTITWMLFIFFMGITSYFAYFHDQAIAQYIKVIKIQLISFLTMMLINDFKKLKQLIWVIVLSIGFFSIKGGLFTVMTGGGYKVYGPDGFIADNNALAIAILMIIPLMNFLYQTTRNLFIKKGLIVAIILSSFTVLGSQSRGALLAILVVCLFYWTKSNSKIVSGFFIIILGAILLSFMPDSWVQRMNTIESYDEDSSAMGRLNAWEYAFNVANSNLLGLGFESWSHLTFAMYAPNPTDVHAAHSIYFSVLADHGWIGLFLWGLIYWFSRNQLNFVIKKTNDDDEMKEYNLLARMLYVGFIAYFVGGAFLSLSYFDLPWHFVGLSVLLKQFFLEKKEQAHGQIVLPENK